MTAVRIARLATTANDFDAQLQRVLHWSAQTDRAIEATVWHRRRRARAPVTSLFGSTQHGTACRRLVAGPSPPTTCGVRKLPAQSDALQAAALRVRSYHEHQLRASCQSWQIRDADGSLLGQKVTPLDRVGIYVPGGKAAYPSSVLMNAIPAQVAGVGEIVMAVPTPNGQRNALLLAAAHVAGVHRVFTLGAGHRRWPRHGHAARPHSSARQCLRASAKRRVLAGGIDMVAGRARSGASRRHQPDWVAMICSVRPARLAQSILCRLTQPTSTQWPRRSIGCCRAFRAVT